MIDPLETIIQWLASEMSTCAGRVANNHRFTDAWTRGQRAMSVHDDDLGQELYGAIHTGILEVRMYGATKAEINSVFLELQQLCRDSKRFEVATSQGSALVHYCFVSSGMTTPYDDDLRQDIGIAYLQYMVAQDAVGE
jgi:hypothetical protein